MKRLGLKEAFRIYVLEAKILNISTVVVVVGTALLYFIVGVWLLLALAGIILVVLRLAQVLERSDDYFCASCEYVLRYRTNFCPNCGKSFPEKKE